MTRSGPQTRLATGALVPPHLLTGGAMNAKARAVHKRGSLENMVSVSGCCSRSCVLFQSSLVVCLLELVAAAPYGSHHHVYVLR